MTAILHDNPSPAIQALQNQIDALLNRAEKAETELQAYKALPVVGGDNGSNIAYVTIPLKKTIIVGASLGEIMATKPQPEPCCAWCDQEAGILRKAGTSHGICAKHAAQLRGQL